ncbi:MAG: DUF4167 domain-containing protein [Rickettsiales bacterium]
MMRKNNNGGGMKHRGGGRRHHNGGNRNNGGGNRSNGGDQNNIARQKHHAMQMREKYFNMARDAQSNGDRVDIEYYLQHVDHYVRVLADIAVIEAERYAERQQHAPQPSEAADNNAPHAETDAAAAPANNAASGGEEMDLRNQPRMTRAPRQQHQQASNEIPLPGSILTEIPV